MVLQCRHINKTLDNCFNFENISFHESLHSFDKSTFNGGIGEVNAILQQTNHPSWEKTSMEFKHSQAAYAASSLNKERKIGNEEINLFVDRLNNAFEGYSFFSNNGGSVDASYMIPPLVVEPSK